MLNITVFLGRLASDPELRATNNDIPVTSFRIAVQRDISKEGETDFFDVTAWRQTAEFICKYFSKGKMICVVGRLQNKSWEDKHGQKRTATELVADRAYFPGDKLRNTDAPSPFNADAPSPFGDDDDDLPFA